MNEQRQQLILIALLCLTALLLIRRRRMRRRTRTFVHPINRSRDALENMETTTRRNKRPHAVKKEFLKLHEFIDLEDPEYLERERKLRKILTSSDDSVSDKKLPLGDRNKGRRRSLRCMNKRLSQLKTEKQETSETSDSSGDEEWTPDALPRKKINKKAVEVPAVVPCVSDEENNESRELTEFEILRKRNIEERNKLFEELNLGGIKKELEEVVKKTPSSSRHIFRRSPSPVIPREKSLRIQGIKAREPEREAEKIREQMRYNSVRGAIPGDWDSKPRNNKKVIPFEELLVPTFSEEYGKTFITSCCEMLCEYKHNNKPDTTNVTKFIKTLMDLEITENNKLKVVPNRIYSMAVHPSFAGTLVAAGCKSGTLGLWSNDLQGLQTEDCKQVAYRLHSMPISCISFDESQPNVMYTTSYDGTVRRGDLFAEKFELIYATDESYRNNHLSWHCELSPQVLLIGKGDGSIAKLDVREPKESVKLYKCHDRSLRTISLHPVTKQHIATTSSSKRVVSIWDLRKMSTKKGLGHGELSSIHFNKPLSGAFFSPLTGNSLLTTSYENNICVFDTSDLNNPTLQHKVPHYNETGRWLTNFKARWHPHREDVFIVGSMAKPRVIDVYNLTPGSNESLIHISDPELLTTVGAVAMFHPNIPAILAGNASGYVHLFK